MEFTLILFVLIASLILCYIYSSKRDINLNLPGPAGYPIVGNILDLDLKCIHHKLFQWSEVYGEMFKIKLLSQTCVVVNSSKLLREMFSKEPNATLTSARPDTFFKQYILRDSDVIMSSFDKEWIKRRKLMYKLLHAYGEGMEYTIGEINNKLFELRKELSLSGNLARDPRDMIDDFVLCIIEILLVGRSSEEGSEFRKYIKDLDDCMNVLANPGVEALYYNFPFLRFMPLPSTDVYKKCVVLRDGLLDIVEKHSEKSSVGIYPNMKTILESGKCNDTDAPWFTENVMTAMLINMIGGAFLTTRSLLSSLVRILMSAPDVQSKLQAEVDRVIGHDRQPSLKDRQNLAYTEAFILETLRFTSHVPSSIIHATANDVVIGNVTIPKDTVIIPNLWTIHHSRKEWKDPFKFTPERYLTETGDILPADHELRKRFMAFGHGKRSCVGKAIAKSRSFLFLCTLMQEFSVIPPNDGEIPPMLDPWQMVPGIVMQPHPYTCRFIKRDHKN